MSASYQEALDYLYGFVNFEHRRLDRYSPENISLERVHRFLGLLGDPQTKFPSIHIAGTKGKGSVAAMCAFSFRASGLRCGLYTSPHLQDFRDRIRILTPDDTDGRISEENVVRMVGKVKLATEQISDLTWYELVTAMAFLHFAEEGVDVAVVEVGLGGRLDASNVLMPLVSVITSLSLDHTYLLGDTLAEIAVEKGGIIKEGVPVISASQEPEAIAEIERICTEKNAPLTLIGGHWSFSMPVNDDAPKTKPLPLSQEITITEAPQGALIPTGSQVTVALAGRHQQENAVVAIAALDIVKADFPELTASSVRKGLEQVFWPGRMQILAHGQGIPTLLVDCAHNVDSASKLAHTLEHDFEYDRLVLVLGTTADKDVEGIMKVLLPISDYILLTSSGHPRASEPGELVQFASELGFASEAKTNVAVAIQSARLLAGDGDLVCVTGSIFVVGDLLNQWESLQSQLWVERK